MTPRPRIVALVVLGGFAGANARWLLGVVLARLLGAGAVATLVPTLVANVTGAFALGAVLTAVAAGRLRAPAKAVAATGFLSSYTTYSTFAVESALAGTPALIAGNVVANYALGFAGAIVGRIVARQLLDASVGGEPT
ncbi:MAG: CrcB family protein [Halolamina sp.]